MPEVILVLGPHRSGTSILNGCLNILGYNVGDHLLPSNKGNPKGYFEDKDIIKINDMLLDTFSRRWDDTRPLPDNWHLSPKILPHSQLAERKIISLLSNSEKLSLKDPRICRLLPFWLDLFDRLEIIPKLIVLVRKPLQCTLSLMRRDNASFAQSALIWLRYELELMVSLQNHDFHTIFLHDIQSDPVRSIDKIPGVDINEEKKLEIESFFSEKLLKSSSLPEDFLEDLCEEERIQLKLCDEAYNQMEHRDHQWFKLTLHELNNSYRIYHREIDNALNRQFMSPNSIENLKEQIEIHKLRLELETLKKQLRELKN